MLVNDIEFRSVNKSFNKKPVLKEINLKINKGDFFGIIGVSGAGKTTLLRLLVGFYNADKGKLFFQGKDVTNKINQIRHLVGFASQEGSFYEKLTVEENLKYFGRLHGMEENKINYNTSKYIRLVELTNAKNTPAKDLSGGMQRRLDLACSLMHDPKVLILDEPTTGLDPVLRKHMLKLIKTVNNLGTTVIMSSHLLGEVEHQCNRVAIIHHGTILVEDSPQSLKSRYSSNEEVVLETFPANYDLVIRTLKQYKLPISYIAYRDHRLVIYTPQAETILHYTLHILEQMKETLLDVDVNKPALAEVFEALTEKNQHLPPVNQYEQLKASIKNAFMHGYSEIQVEKQLRSLGYNNRTIYKVMRETA